MLQGVVVVEKALLGVEGRVEVGKVDLAEVVLGELREPGEARQSIEGVAADEQVIGRPRLPNVSHDSHVMEEPDLGHPVVRRRHPLVGPILVGEEAPVLVGPGQLQATLVVGHHAAPAVTKVQVRALSRESTRLKAMPDRTAEV